MKKICIMRRRFTVFTIRERKELRGKMESENKKSGETIFPWANWDRNSIESSFSDLESTINLPSRGIKHWGGRKRAYPPQHLTSYDYSNNSYSLSFFLHLFFLPYIWLQVTLHQPSPVALRKHCFHFNLQRELLHSPKFFQHIRFIFIS